MSGASLEGRPSEGLRGTLHDLEALAFELLVPRALPPSVVALGSTVAFPGLRGVLPGFGVQDPLDWGLGLEVRGTKAPHWTGAGNSPRTFGHFGGSGTFLWVDPDAGLALVALTDRTFGAWAVERVAGVLGQSARGRGRLTRTSHLAGRRRRSARVPGRRATAPRTLARRTRVDHPVAR